MAEIYFSVGFLRLVCLDGAAAIVVCKSERDLGRVSKLLRGGEQSWPNPAPLGSLDTLPRLRSLHRSVPIPRKNMASVISLSFSNLFSFQGR